MMTTWAGLGRRIDELERQVADKDKLRAQGAEALHTCQDELAEVRRVKYLEVRDEHTKTLKSVIADLKTIIRNQAVTIKELRREAAILREYRHVVALLVDTRDVLCKLFEGRP